MRLFGLLGIVLALLIVGVLVKKQFSSIALPSVPPVSGATAAPPAGTVRDQSQQIQQQVRQAVDAAVQRHPLPDDN